MEIPYEKETVRSRHGNRNRNHWRFSCFGGLKKKKKIEPTQKTTIAMWTETYDSLEEVMNNSDI